MISKDNNCSNLVVEAEKIALYNLPRWAKRTFIADRRTFVRAERKMTYSRIFNSLITNLKKPIFLVGSPRSGTTFLGSCLASLPEVSYHFEPIATKAASRYVYEGYWGELKSKWFYRNVYAWLMRINLDGDIRFAEKTPRNCFLLPFLSKCFSDARFIHIVRDGRDVALSLSKKPWFLADQANSGRYEPGGYPYGPYAQFWVEQKVKRRYD